MVITVLHIITRLDRGGSAQNTLKSCIGLARKNYRVILVSGPSVESKMTSAEREVVENDIRIARDNGVKFIVVNNLVRRINPILDTMCFITFFRLFRLSKPVVVHTHTSKAGILGRLAAWLVGVPVIIHTPHGHVFYGHFSKHLSNIFLFIERIFDKITDITIALTDGERNDYIKNSVSEREKLAIIHSGVEVKKFLYPLVTACDKKRALGIGAEEKIIGTVGWLLPIKGPAYLLEAMGEVWHTNPKTKLMFVGKGELEYELKIRAAEMGAKDQVLFMGWRDEIPDIMHMFDIFVLPSLNEGMGRVIVEAMAAGKPVVASNTGGIPDLVIESETGLLVEPADVIGLAKAIITLLENPELRQSMGKAGRERCHLFSEELMIDKIDKLYRELIARKGIRTFNTTNRTNQTNPTNPTNPTNKTN